MNTKEAKKLLPLTVVVWDKNPDDLGIVRETAHGGVFIDWENGRSGWIAFQDMEKISIR